jgi:hypothetical protein
MATVQTNQDGQAERRSGSRSSNEKNHDNLSLVRLRENSGVLLSFYHIGPPLSVKTR